LYKSLLTIPLLVEALLTVTLLVKALLTVTLLVEALLTVTLLVEALLTVTLLVEALLTVTLLTISLLWIRLGDYHWQLIFTLLSLCTPTKRTKVHTVINLFSTTNAILHFPSPQSSKIPI
jgi:hypothetical protein